MKFSQDELFLFFQTEYILRVYKQSSRGKLFAIKYLGFWTFNFVELDISLLFVGELDTFLFNENISPWITFLKEIFAFKAVKMCTLLKTENNSF